MDEWSLYGKHNQAEYLHTFIKLHCAYNTLQGHGNVPVQHQTQLRLNDWAVLFTLHCSSSLTCMRGYLAIDSGGYNHVNEYSLPSNCSIA